MHICIKEEGQRWLGDNKNVWFQPEVVIATLSLLFLSLSFYIIIERSEEVTCCVCVCACARVHCAYVTGGDLLCSERVMG